MADDLTKFYAALAVLAPVWSFMPLYDTDDVHLASAYHGSLWEMTGEHGGVFGVLGLVAVALLTVLLAVAAKGDVRVPVPAVIAVLCVLMAVAVLGKPGTVAPDVADSGRAAVALLAVTVVLAVRHIAALVSAARRVSVDDKP
jgi:hypothetical protein